MSDRMPSKIIIGFFVLVILVVIFSYVSFSSSLITNLGLVLSIGSDAQGNNITNASQIEAEVFLQNQSVVCDKSGNCNTTYGNDTLQTVTDRGSTTTNNITADTYFGNGSQLTGIDTASPAGADTQIQYNDGGSFGGISTVKYDGSIFSTSGKTIIGSNTETFSEVNILEIVDGSGSYNGNFGRGASLPYFFGGATNGDGFIFQAESGGSAGNILDVRDSFGKSQFSISNAGSVIQGRVLADGENSIIGTGILPQDTETLTVRRGLAFGTTEATLALKQTSSYTGNLTEWQDNNFNILAHIDNSGNANFPKITTGSNTFSGLSDGDINVSTIYYDTLQAKSPIVMCSDLNCKVEVPELKETYYIERDANYNILSFDKPLPQVVTDKFAELKAKKLTDDARESCLAQGRFYEFNNNNCQLNKKAQCESDGKSYWTGSQCLENPYLKCENSDTKSWNLTTNTCQHDPIKACNSQDGKKWDKKQNSCIDKVIPEKTLKEKQRECLRDPATMWKSSSNECVELRLYLAEPYKQPTGAHDAYNTGDVIKWNGEYYESTIDANVWNPSTYPQGWEKI